MTLGPKGDTYRWCAMVRVSARLTRIAALHSSHHPQAAGGDLPQHLNSTIDGAGSVRLRRFD